MVLANLLNTGLDPLPGINAALLISLIATLLLTFLIIPYGKRRAVGAPLSWGEAMAASVYAFGVMFLAYGIVPHQWLTHADNELSWRKDVIVFGPFNLLQPQALGGWFPFTINASHVKDIIATLIYVVLFGVQLWLWAWWQKRGKTKSTEIAVSSYGRPLVRKA